MSLEEIEKEIKEGQKTYSDHIKFGYARGYINALHKAGVITPVQGVYLYDKFVHPYLKSI